MDDRGREQERPRRTAGVQGALLHGSPAGR